MNVAIIPARGGSKRIPRKNIKLFCGKPMIAWPIIRAKESGLFDSIIVSTDDEEIAQISKFYGAEVPFKRSPELSDDYTGTIDVVANAVSWMKNQGWALDLVCCIYATSIFFKSSDIKKGYNAIREKKWSYSFSVTSFDYPIFRSIKKRSDGGVEMFYPEYFESRSQDLPKALHDAAQFYWGKPDSWLKNIKLFEKKSFPVELPNWRVQDIDDQNDWKRAEILFNYLNQGNNV